MKDRKGLTLGRKGLTLGEFSGMALMFVVTAITIAIGATILTGVRATQTANAADYNVTTYGLTGSTTLGSWLPTCF